MSALDERGAACRAKSVTVPAVSCATDRKISAAWKLCLPGPVMAWAASAPCPAGSFFFFLFHSENRKHNITHRGEVRSCHAAPHTNASQLNEGGGGLNCETHTALSLRLCWLGLEGIRAADLWWRHVNESQRESVQHIQLRAARPERKHLLPVPSAWTRLQLLKMSPHYKCVHQSYAY